MAEVVQRLGTDRTFVIHGDGVDELPLDGSGVLYVIADDTIERHEDEPRHSGSSERRPHAWPAGHPRRTRD